MMDGIFRPDSAVLYPTLVRGRTDQPQVALTFDDGPDPEVTPVVLDLLAQCEARATFFVIGRHLEKHRALGERMLREGHEIGITRGNTRTSRTFIRQPGYGVEIDRCSQLIKSVTQSTREPLFRPPVGLKESRRWLAPRISAISKWSHGQSIPDMRLKAQCTCSCERSGKSIRPGDIALLQIRALIAKIIIARLSSWTLPLLLGTA